MVNLTQKACKYLIRLYQSKKQDNLTFDELLKIMESGIKVSGYTQKMLYYFIDEGLLEFVGTEENPSRKRTQRKLYNINRREIIKTLRRSDIWNLVIGTEKKVFKSMIIFGD